MTKPEVAVVGYGTIGQRLADGVARQKDMELVGVSDVAPTLPVRALKEKGMPYDLYCAIPNNIPLLEDAGIPVTGTLDDLLKKVQVLAKRIKRSIENMVLKPYFKAEKKTKLLMSSSMDMPITKKA